MPAGQGTAQRATKQPNPRDFTGVQKAKLEAEHADEIEERAEELATLAQSSKRRKAEVVDYSQGGHAVPGQLQPQDIRGVSDELAAQIEESAVEVGPVLVTIRVNSKIEDMVFARFVEPAEFDDDGKLVKHAIDHGLQFYSFEEGTPYRVPRHIAEHLDTIGYLYH